MREEILNVNLNNIFNKNQSSNDIHNMWYAFWGQLRIFNQIIK